MRRVLAGPPDPGSPPLAFAVVRVPFLLEPDCDESEPFVKSNGERLVKKWGGREGWEMQKQRHECVIISFFCIFAKSICHTSCCHPSSSKGRGIAAGIPPLQLG